KFSLGIFYQRPRMSKVSIEATIGVKKNEKESVNNNLQDPATAAGIGKVGYFNAKEHCRSLDLIRDTIVLVLEVPGQFQIDRWIFFREKELPKPELAHLTAYRKELPVARFYMPWPRSLVFDESKYEVEYDAAARVVTLRMKLKSFYKIAVFFPVLLKGIKRPENADLKGERSKER